MEKITLTKLVNQILSEKLDKIYSHVVSCSMINIITHSHIYDLKAVIHHNQTIYNDNHYYDIHVGTNAFNDGKYTKYIIEHVADDTQEVLEVMFELWQQIEYNQ